MKSAARTGASCPTRWLDKYEAHEVFVAVLLGGTIDLDRDAVASQIVALVDGLQLQSLLDPGAADMTAVFEDFLARLRPQ
jgi:hypothetical protein